MQLVTRSGSLEAARDTSETIFSPGNLSSRWVQHDLDTLENRTAAFACHSHVIAYPEQPIGAELADLPQRFELATCRLHPEDR